MTKYDVVKNIMESQRVNEDEQAYFIEMYIKGWFTVDEIKWIWE